MVEVIQSISPCVNPSFVAILEILLPCASTLIGVIIGASLSRKANEKQNRERMLAEFYAEILTNYANYGADPKSKEKRFQLIASIEKAMLICPLETDMVLKDLRRAILNESGSGYAALILEFRKSACKDIDGFKKQRRKGSRLL